MRVALGRIARHIDRHSAEEGLTRTQFSILSTAARRGPLGVRELAEIEGINPTMLSRMLGKLESADLIVRTADSYDKRAVNVQVTDSGGELFLRLRAKRTALLEDRLNRLPDGQAATLLEALGALEALSEELAKYPSRSISGDVADSDRQ
ncbi:MarR family winged helix-turn-helix transcriptional regulator [Rhodococcus sp. NPDC058521]|uniref:MarR family winged helix-turn-helix transcriptional regulator n=1 Tax=Rhodococcus sp. NPDC058521 TaxID=3346536 RepID=UPI0036521C70